MEKFTVLDDIPFWQRTLLLALCAGSCCWGFVNTTILLVFAGKIGFPLAVAICAMTINAVQIQRVVYYTLFLVLFGLVYFTVNEEFVISGEFTKNFVPSITDTILAVVMGWAMSRFWYHPIRINIIILSAGLTSLLPACIMSGYWLSKHQYYFAMDSMILYIQYVIGMVIGAVLERKIWK